MKYEVVELEEKRIEGLAVRTTNENNKAQADIALLWQRFFTEGVYESILNKANAKTIGLYTNYEGDYTKPYQFIVGVEVKEKTQQVLAIIPKGKYAKFVIKGDIQTAVFRLGRWSSRIPTGFHVSGGTLDPARSLWFSLTGLSPCLACLPMQFS